MPTFLSSSFAIFLEHTPTTRACTRERQVDFYYRAPAGRCDENDIPFPRRFDVWNHGDKKGVTLKSKKVI